MANLSIHQMAKIHVLQANFQTAMRFSRTNLTSDISFMDSPAKGKSLSPNTDPPETIAAKGVYECLLWIYF